MEAASGSSSSRNPTTIEEIFRDYKGRHAGLVRALTHDVDTFFAHCDPGMFIIAYIRCHYGYLFSIK
ncbi:hypothetical protein HanRHA438_Chr11g0513301 [Helianthus annuus]|uniref:PHD finger protein ALFIN-LIKE n=1 Tax=Helianthus annuus TaxID=4232 RepID=A0A251TEQ6_HELAN|nr:hypothetical protein HanXRQr2_Chr11g0500541 [Helianthus annuus]KAJ0502269.1 hypothetical protein HanHA300_Chr11g0410851 [Helianthus annuus]KAJ0510279.1 hypothetical protein HanIR_Chr11g0538881 [Helianthus annuus]KAJ0518192.1 hypothetical protein HanHA89_Chr11g0434531 [Helianthus annuus]KAJ0686223.1 hypothetical protein HanLR1_Chr11g0412181 [Helianthus annuus]